MTNSDKIAQDLADVFAQCDDSTPVFDLAYKMAAMSNCNFVIAIDKDGNNVSKGFPVTEYRSSNVEQYFEETLGSGSKYQFKFYIWA